MLAASPSMMMLVVWFGYQLTLTDANERVNFIGTAAFFFSSVCLPVSTLKKEREEEKNVVWFKLKAQEKQLIVS